MERHKTACQTMKLCKMPRKIIGNFNYNIRKIMKNLRKTYEIYNKVQKNLGKPQEVSKTESIFYSAMVS